MKKNILIVFFVITNYSKITNTHRLSKKVKNRSEQVIIPNNQTIVNNLPLQSTPPYTTNSAQIQSQPYSPQQVQSENQTQGSYSNPFMLKPRKHKKHYSYDDTSLPSPEEYNALMEYQTPIVNNPLQKETSMPVTQGIKPITVQSSTPLQTIMNQSLVKHVATPSLPITSIPQIPPVTIKTPPIQQVLPIVTQAIKSINQTPVIPQPIIKPSIVQQIPPSNSTIAGFSQMSQPIIQVLQNKPFQIGNTIKNPQIK